MTVFLWILCVISLSFGLAYLSVKFLEQKEDKDDKNDDVNREINSCKSIAEGYLQPYRIVNVEQRTLRKNEWRITLKFQNKSEDHIYIRHEGNLTDQDIQECVKQWCQEKYLHWWNLVEEKEREHHRLMKISNSTGQDITQQDLARWVLEGKPGARRALQESVKKER